MWIDQDGFTSIIFDITQRVDAPGAGLERDGRALTIHLEDLVGDDTDSVKVWNTTETQFSNLECAIPFRLPFPLLDITSANNHPNSEGTPAYTLIATQTPQASSDARGSAPDFTALILTLLRFEKERSDVLITINVPHIKGEYDEDDVDLALGKQGELIGDAVEYAAQIWETFKVKDWHLFADV